METSEQTKFYFWNLLEKTNGEAFGENTTFPTVKHGGGSILLWGCVATGGTGNILLVEGRMDSTKF